MTAAGRAADPYHDRKVIHRAGLVSRTGKVSARCFPTPRPINLKVASWTLRDDAVTCPKCQAWIKGRKA